MDIDTDDDGRELAWELALELDGTPGAHTILVEQRAAADDDGPAGSTFFVASTDDEDRALDVVRQDWRLNNFKRNPVILDNHRPMRVAGRGEVRGADRFMVRTGGDLAGKLAGRVFWDLESPDPTIRVVGHQHVNGFRSAGSVGFRHGRRTERHKLNKDSPYYREPIKIETWWGGEIERSGYLFEKNELLEFSSATIPMNPEALQRALSAGDPGAQVADRLRELDPGDIERRLAVLEQTVERDVADHLRASLPGMLEDPETRAAVLDLLVPDLHQRMRDDPTFRHIVEGYAGAHPVRAPAPPVIPGNDPLLDHLFGG